MVARVTISQSPPERFDEVIAYVQNTLVPQLKQIPGVTASYVLADRQSGKGMVVTVYESEDALRAADQRAQQMRGQAMQTFSGMALQSVETYEVVGQV